MKQTMIRLGVVALGLGLVACTTSDPLNTAGRRGALVQHRGKHAEGGQAAHPKPSVLLDME